MPETGLPIDVIALLRERIASLDQLQVLLVLYDHKPQAWSSDAIAEMQRMPASIVSEALEHLAAKGLLARQTSGSKPTFAFSPTSRELSAGVDALVQVFRKEPLGVMKVMNEHALERVRARAMHTFADAFVLQRKRDKDG